MAARVLQAGVDLLTRPWVASCDETMARASDHLDGELGWWREWRVVRHLARCERCRAVVASLRRAVEQLRELGSTETVAPSPAFVDAVLGRIERERGDPPERRTR